jgi:hypothetical protein
MKKFFMGFISMIKDDFFFRYIMIAIAFFLCAIMYVAAIMLLERADRFC